MAMYSVPSGHTAHIDNIVLSVNRGSGSGTKEADISVCVREFGGVFRAKNMMGLSNIGTGLFDYQYRYPLKISEKSDICLRAYEVSSNNTDISALFTIVLKQN